MPSKFARRSYLARLGASAGIGALAVITGACSESGSADADMGGDPSAASTESEAAPRTDSDTAPAKAAGEAARTDSDAAATEEADQGASADGSTDSEGPGASY